MASEYSIKKGGGKQSVVIHGDNEKRLQPKVKPQAPPPSSIRTEMFKNTHRKRRDRDRGQPS